MESNGHIIVCDDEQDIRDMLCEYLEHHGYAVSGAGNGEALRALLEDGEPDVVILDVNMPGEDGLSLTRFLRGNCETRWRPIKDTHPTSSRGGRCEIVRKQIGSTPG